MIDTETREIPATGDVCPAIHEDLNRGTKALSVVIYGTDTKARAVQYLYEKGELNSLFKFNGQICGFTSEIRKELYGKRNCNV